jgi:hypothetical protein
VDNALSDSGVSRLVDGNIRALPRSGANRGTSRGKIVMPLATLQARASVATAASDSGTRCGRTSAHRLPFIRPPATVSTAMQHSILAQRQHTLHALGSAVPSSRLRPATPRPALCRSPARQPGPDPTTYRFHYPRVRNPRVHGQPEHTKMGNVG